MKDHMIDFVQFNMKLTTILAASILTLLKQFILEHVFSDIQFLIGITLLFTLDNLSGTVKALVKGEFDLPTYFKKTIVKIAAYAFFIGGVGILLKMKVDNQKAEWIQGVDDYLYMGVALAEFWSIVQNINAINPTLLPSWITKLFKDAAEKGQLTKPNFNP